MLLPFDGLLTPRRRLLLSVHRSAAALGTGKIHAGRPSMSHNVLGFCRPSIHRSALVLQRPSRNPLCTDHVHRESVSFVFIRTNQGGPKAQAPSFPADDIKPLHPAYPPPVSGLYTLPRVPVVG
ncbi:hypothetical protein CGRA01v4_11256 [Colletotrichum graminicola]|nr:hypothetical protein CGRA01v4_11256 [Colletotrichum graminicola]